MIKLKINYHLIVLLIVTEILLTGCNNAKTSKPLQSQTTDVPKTLTVQQEVTEKEEAESELFLLSEWFNISRQLEQTLNKIDENIKNIQSGKIFAKEMMKPMSSLKKELLKINQDITMLSTLNNQTLYDAKKIYYEETNNICQSIDRILDWLTEVELGKIKRTDTAELENYKEEINKSISKIKNTELSVKKIESEIRKKVE